MTKKNKKKATVGIALFAVISILIWQYTSSSSKDFLKNVTIAQTNDFFLYAPVYIAIDAGIFKSHGLNVNLVSTGGDEKTWAAVISGDASFGVADPTFVAISSERG